MTDLEAIRQLLDRRRNDGKTHWDGCRGEHIDCAAAALLAEVERLRAENKRLRRERDTNLYWWEVER